MSDRIQYIVSIKGVGSPPEFMTRSEKIEFLKGNIPIKEAFALEVVALDPQVIVESLGTMFEVLLVTTTAEVAQKLKFHPQVTEVECSGSFVLA